jgi:hypothetical protein
MLAKSSPGVFTYGHLFQRGDLPLFVTDYTGNPFSPYSVQYALFHQPKDSPNLQRSGPCGRIPVQADVGEYYATGYAGECSQPGQWFIRWFLQEYFGGSTVEAEFGFVVYDSSSYSASGAVSNQSCGCGGLTHGWHCGGSSNCPPRTGW